MKRLTALLAGFLLRHAGLWLCEWSFSVERWGGVDHPEYKVGGTI